ncbi:AAA family ATPase [Peribacillus muralis]|uniref:AAA family ATPase n=1 Tax=Peribacillus muralis TaxID=264697 RepID=UPI00070D3F4B|nr:AAA family ATPase [Peribacillus muralis]
MDLYSLGIEGYRRHLDTTVLFSDATFLIGENNKGKSSILHALNILLNDAKRIPDEEFSHRLTEDGNSNERICEQVVLTAEFRNVSKDAVYWKGFKGRVLKYNPPAGTEETGYKIIYRKIFKPNTNYTVQMKEYNKVMIESFKECMTLNSFIDAGLPYEVIKEVGLDSINLDKKLSIKQIEAVHKIDDLYEVDETQESWFENPGGIPAIVLQKLPKFLLIPAQDKASELSSTSGALYDTLNELFKDVRDSSDNFKQAQTYLNLLAAELDPADSESEFGVMMTELNSVLSNIFPEIGIKAETTLGEADKNIKPNFKISLQSNVLTSVALQGTGVIRSAVFALLRYRTMRENKKIETKNVRPLLIGFEEPEIYLHPNAANQMRNTIYELAGFPFNQIVCTTHSPYMIDLSQKPAQILNNLILDKNSISFHGGTIEVEKITCNPFNTSLAFKQLQGDEKDYVKMLLKMDDYISRAFFSKNVLIVEGDTEDIILRETISRMPSIVRVDILHNWQIIKARGKSSIISLVKYLSATGIVPYVIHDRDQGTPGAEIFNTPILEAMVNPNRRFMLEECIEDALGYPAPSAEKPSKAYIYIQKSCTKEWSSIPEKWREIVETIFEDSFNLLNNEPIINTDLSDVSQSLY